MTSSGRAVGFGVLVWLIPFAVAFLVYPLRASSRPLFESIMPVAVAAAAVVLGVAYFRHVIRQHVREGAVVGFLWLVICVLIDAPLMLLGGPMRMAVPEYLADIGLTYVIIPIVTVGIGAAVAARSARPAADQDAA
jgi:hypothetical protein